MRTKNIYPTQLVIKRKEVKQPSGGDRLTLQYVEDVAKSIQTEINLYDEHNNIAGGISLYFKGFCAYYYPDGTHAGSGAMYHMGISLRLAEKIGCFLRISGGIGHIYHYQPMGNVVKGERNVVKSLGSNPEIHEESTRVAVNRYVVTADKKEVSYNQSGAYFSTVFKDIEILGAGCNSSAGFAEMIAPIGANRQCRVLKRSVSVDFVIKDLYQ